LYTAKIGFREYFVAANSYRSCCANVPTLFLEILAVRMMLIILMRVII